MEILNQYFKDRTEGFDDYYPCIRNEWVPYFMCIAGYNFSFLCTIVLQQQVVMILILSLMEVKLSYLNRAIKKVKSTNNKSIGLLEHSTNSP